MQANIDGVDLAGVAAVNHEGKVVVVVADTTGRLFYSVRRTGFEPPSPLPLQMENWEDFREVPLPGIGGVEDPDESVASWERDNASFPLAEQNDDVQFAQRSHVDTATAANDESPRLVSHSGTLYVFRQASGGNTTIRPGAILVDRFVLDGLENRLVRRLDVRFKRSGRRHEPATSSDGDSLDSPDHRDADGQPFYEPTIEIGFLPADIEPGSWGVESVPTSDPQRFRWHFASVSSAGRLQMTSVASTSERLFDVRDRNGSSGISTREFTLPAGRMATGWVGLARFDKQRTDPNDETGERLIRTTTHLMLTVPVTTPGGEPQGSVALELDLAADGTLRADAAATPELTQLRADITEQQLPVDAIAEIRSVRRQHAATEPVTSISQRSLRTTQVDLASGPASIGAARTIEMRDATSIDGVYTMQAFSLGRLDRGLRKGATHIEVNSPLEAPVPPGLRFRLQHGSDQLGVVTTRTRQTGSQVGDVRIGIETSTITAPRDATVTCLDAFQVATQGSLGTARPAADRDAPTIRAGQITRVDDLGNGDVRLHAFAHGLSDGTRVRVQGIPVIDGDYDAELDEAGDLVIGARWLDAEVSDLQQRSGLVLADGSYAVLPIDADIGRPGADSTIEFWFRADPLANVIFNNSGFGFSTQRNGSIALAVPGTANADVPNPGLGDQWVHVAIVFTTDATVRLFIDGARASTLQVRPGTRLRQPNGELRIGGTPATTTELSDLRVWSRALDDAAVSAGMYRRLNGREDGLVGMWPMKAIVEGDTRVLVDRSARGRDGICSDGAFVVAPVLPATIDGERVESFENPDMVEVVAGAVYEEVIELQASVNGRTLGRAAVESLLTCRLWGQRNAIDDTPIHHDQFVVHGSTVEAIGSTDWLQLTTRYTSPPSATLVRTFGLDLSPNGDLDELRVRRVRLQRTSGSVSRSGYTTTVGVATVDDREAGTELEELRSAESLEAERIDELRRALSVDALARAGELENEIGKARDAAELAEEQLGIANDEYLREARDALNYWNALEVDGQFLTVEPRTDNLEGWVLRATRASSGDPPESARWAYDHSTGRFISAVVSRHYGEQVLSMSSNLELRLGAARFADDGFDRWDVIPAPDGATNPVTEDGPHESVQLRNRQTGDVLKHRPENGRWAIGGSTATTFRMAPWGDGSWPRRITQPSTTYSRTSAKAHVLQLRSGEKNLADKAFSELETARQGEVGGLKTSVTKAREKVAKAREPLSGELLDSFGVPGNVIEVAPGVRAWALTGVSPPSSGTLSDGGDGQVALTYADRDGIVTHVTYGAVAGRSDFGTWRRVPPRQCVDMPGAGHIVLDPAVGGPDSETTVEMWLHLPWGSDAIDLDDVDHVAGERIIAQAADGAIVSRSSDGRTWWFGILLGSEFYRARQMPDDAGWHHLAVVSSGAGPTSTTRFYLDGQPYGDVRRTAVDDARLRGETTAETKTAIEAAEARTYRLQHPLTSVGSPDPGQLPLGKLAEVRVWRLALTPEEVEAHSRVPARGTEPGLVHALPLDGSGICLTASSARLVGVDLAADVVPWSGRLESLPERAAGPTATVEYGSSLVDPDTGVPSTMLRRVDVAVVAGSGSRRLAVFSHLRVEELERRWIGTTQFAPSLVGYIEGPPPVPSENLTLRLDHPSYEDAASVQLSIDTAVGLSWERELSVSSGSMMDAFVGVDVIGTVGVQYRFRGGVTASSRRSLADVNSSAVEAVATDATTDRLSLRGTVERDPAFPDLGARFVPKNVGYALVVSGVADMYVLRLRSTGTMIGYDVVPANDIPRQVNTVTFRLNPAYIQVGSLDGLIGSHAADERFHRHVPAAREQYGARYPASYLRIDEAFRLQAEIERADRERMAFFASFNSRDPGQAMGREEIESVDEDSVVEEARRRSAQVLSANGGYELYEDAVRGVERWKARMRQLTAEAGRQDIVNVYVWDADGGFRTEQQSFADTTRLSLGHVYEQASSVGAEASGAWAVAGELTLQSTLQVSQLLMKTEETHRAVSLEVDVGGIESGGVTDADDRPLHAGGKVDRYRFMSFYRGASQENYAAFFDRVVDPAWLQGNTEEARVLRSIDPGQPSSAWRVFHRVTHVERPALASAGRNVDPSAGGVLEPAVTLEDLNDRLTEIDEKVSNIRRSVRLLESDQT